MHYLAYVYGPSDKETLERIMAPYDEDPRPDQKGALGHELVVMTNIPVMTLETTLFDMICAFRKVIGNGYGKQSPILIVDDAYSFLDIPTLRELDAFVISYNLDSKAATAKMLVSRAFWDWWVVGGRWPIQFKGKSAHGWYTNVVAPAEVSWAVDKEALETMKENRYTSLAFKDIDWESEKKERVRLALETWDIINKHLPGIGRASDIMVRQNLPNGAKYYNFDHTEYDEWHNRVRAIVDAFMPKSMDLMFGPFEVAGMTRREVIRYALARTFVPGFGIFWSNEFDPYNQGVTESTAVFDFSWGEHPTDEQCKAILRRVRNLKPTTIVTAIDIHN